ncbi:leucine/isoleucine/valine transporter subunit; membrane component of ABC superfamily protein [Beijerinckiaceae bacterium RH AL1]|nr:leucine/isoleucine/valine transporter subunit; membrane component of ABC superfamily protein [Beijerinckiaceae bacterium RH CH11]VVB49297.1 leucine/isoleucine/valine transporter subunit; membrane component of ABC superfamily protein [Beijerinckiaceae bacterium RH AL8]VVC56788.1 leucine/isoleucine/valine transporter subunit; membrane component of ABC superfamily protein [Beijerinckiaceae bacterium RH AL1]
MRLLDTVRDALPAPAWNAISTGAMALVLAVPFVGVRLDSDEGRNTLAFHPLDMAIAVGAVVLFRLALDAYRATRASRPGTPTTVVSRRTRKLAGRAAGIVAIVAALAFPFTPFATRYTLDLGATFFTYVMLGWGLDIVVGMAGLLDLGYVAFYAAGAYTFGILATTYGVGFWEALPLSGLVAGTFGVLLGFPVLRLKGDYLAIVTLGFGEIIRIVIINWYQLTGGPNGITLIPRPTFFGVPFSATAKNGGTTFAHLFNIAYSPLHRVAWLYLVILAMTLATLAFTYRLRRLPIGRAWEALREDEIACTAVGLNPTIIKLTAFAIGATLGGFAGCFFATHQGFISPESFTFTESALVLAIVVLGGGGRFGIAAAAAVLVGAPELGRDFAQYRMLVFGALMVVVMVLRPGGFTGSRTPSIVATRKGPIEPPPAVLTAGSTA